MIAGATPVVTTSVVGEGEAALSLAEHVHFVDGGHGLLEPGQFLTRTLELFRRARLPCEVGQLSGEVTDLGEGLGDLWWRQGQRRVIEADGFFGRLHDHALEDGPV